MVASLQTRKEALEAKLREKTKELKKLCIEEAELTGSLPPETPLEPGESPPQIRRRVGTTFPLPDNLIDKLHSKEAITTLEVDFKIQSGIAEAALGIANDLTSSKSVRRKHKIIYQETQRRLFELESKLNTLKLSQTKKPTTEGETDCIDGEVRDVNLNNMTHPILSHSLSDQGLLYFRHHHHPYSSLPRSENLIYNHNYRGIPCHPLSPSPYYSASGVNMGFRYAAPPLHSTQQFLPSPNQTPLDPCWHGSHSYNVEHVNNNFIVDSSLSIDPYYTPRPQVVEPISRRLTPTLLKESRMAATLPRNTCVPLPSSVLLPGQTYPDNSLMRAQSLGNVGSYQLLTDKKKEKEWYESSLDSSPTLSRHQKPDLVSQSSVSNILSPVSPHAAVRPAPDPNSQEVSAESNSHFAVINSIQFDSVVPYESPKNHTIIEAGKWQPYREVTKPFEMSDFYKYSTKFRKGTSPSPSISQSNDRPVQQQKLVYKPLKPQECQPLSNKNNSGKTKSPYPSESISISPVPADEGMPWYCEKRPVTSSATIV